MNIIKYLDLKTRWSFIISYVTYQTDRQLQPPRYQMIM